MKTFMDRDFMLSTDTACRLFHEYAEKLPIIDYHCHIDPKEIAEDRQFENISQVWLGGDHYKWRLMRAAGVSEKYITGDAPDFDKFRKWAATISRAIGNPLYHWTHLELQRYFGYNGVLSADTAEEVWELTNSRLASADMTARNIIRRSGVDVICTTDDPADDLHFHGQIADDTSFEVKVFPAWRPDRAMNIEKPDFTEYISHLSDVSKTDISSWDGLKAALHKRMAFFASMGCRISDHGLDFAFFSPVDDVTADRLLKKRLAGETLTAEETLQYKTAFLLHMGREYHSLGWAMQIHCGAKRNNNTRMYERIGADTGYDCINDRSTAEATADLLNALEAEGHLPKTIVYSLNPNDNAALDTITGCFQDGESICKIQHGAAWWFNDHEAGMRDQLTSLASLGYLAGFVGMLTDSRSFLSYPRHEYFRRILCDLIGKWVEDGKYPSDMDTLGSIVSDISYNNAKRFFNF